jgi:alanyl-tRNA synthetase
MASHLSAPQIREAFLSFFERNTHRRVASSSLVPANDPTLLFTNAGMVQFKDVFTGREARPYSRATSTQKCVRAGGKHNDLDNVGFTARHHTFFEMLGNFSFGDYFKADAITWAWEFVTKVLALPKERLAVTVFKGEDGIPGDEEAYELWTKTGVAKDRIKKLGLKDNFWAMGETGPCGPCSEIYFYLPNHPVQDGDHPGESDNWLEIWNLVFMQFERKVSGGALVALPKPSIDTGAGLERVSAVVQGKSSNYDTDLFVPLLDKVQALSGKKYEAQTLAGAAMRVIADHARATAFLIADGVQPSNEGRGYVLRRIMRRAIRHGAENLGLDEPFFPQAVESVITLMGAAYPELHERRSFLVEATRFEEDSFRRTLRRGLGLIQQEIGQLSTAGKKAIPGDVVWDLHQTYGFPWDLTQVIAREHDLDVDRAGFEKLLEDERTRGSAGALGQTTAIADVYMRLATRIPETKFLGYETAKANATVLALLKDGLEVQVAKEGDEIEVVFDQSPFYGESGGQIGDTGVISKTNLRLEISDTQKPAGGLLVHHGKLLQGSLAVNDAVTLTVDAARRATIRANHSATHLLHRALRVVLGSTVNQKGSVVSAEALRFDFSHFSQMTPAEIDRVEDLVNGWIRDNEATNTRLMSLAEARASGAVALFGEKYGDVVRVVTVHPESTELCGGTHVSRTGDIGLFRLIEESSVASGVRRVVGLTGASALAYVREQERHLWQAAELYKASPADLSKRIETSQRRIKELEKRIEEVQLKAQSAAGKNDGTLQELNGVKILTQRVDPADASLFRQLADRHRDSLKCGVVGLGGETADGKALILVAATKDLVAKGFKAGDAVRLMAEAIGGKGGGKPDMAQAGGTTPAGVDQALAKLLELVKPFTE